MTQLYNFYKHDLPKKFIAIYSDGSGCDIFYEQGKNEYNSHSLSEWDEIKERFITVDKDWFVDAGYLWFIPLPDDFKVWEET
jgi:hypothetical protein